MGILAAASAPARVEFVSPYKDGVRAKVKKRRLNPFQHASCLLPVRPGTNSKVISRLRKFELLEKDLRHLIIVVLASMQQNFLDSGKLAERTRHDCGLYKLGARTDDGNNSH
jgi:hypothetical protein